MTLPLLGVAAAPDLHVMTYNIRRRLDVTVRPADRWRRRKGPLRSLLRAERPTVLGVQEALPDQAMWVKAALGDAYRLVGRGRGAHGRGEGCPMFYDSERLELLDATQRWLSDEPDIEGSATWGNPVPRILVHTLFRDRATGMRFVAINTHLDVFSRRSRLRSAARLRELAAQDAEPCLVMGDLNASADSEVTRALLAGAVLRDAWAVAEERDTPAWGTFGNYREPRPEGDRIDLIAVSAGVRVRRTAINPHRFDGRFPSDHLPVQALVRLEEGAA